MKSGNRADPGREALPPIHESWLPNEHKLYRPRHSRRQRTALLCAVVFFLAPALAFVAGARPHPFENKPLREFPSPAHGWSFFTALPGWAVDHLPLRQAGVNAAGAIGTQVFGDPPGAVGGARPGNGGVSPGGEQPSEPDAPPPDAFPRVLAGTDGWLYLGNTIRNKCRTAKNVDQIIDALRRLRRAVESSGRQFELVIAPDKATMVPEHLPADFAGEQCWRARTGAFWNRVPGALDTLRIRPALKAAQRRTADRLYDPHGTHWSYAAGLTLTRLLAERLAPGSTTNWKAEPAGTQAWPADLGQLLGKNDKRHLRRYTLAPNGREDQTRYIASNFKQPLHLTQPGTHGTPGTVEEPVAVVADSFTQFATPFLAASLQDVTITHTQTVGHATRNRLTELLADRDVIVFEFVERSIAGGHSILLRDSVLDRITTVLAQNPR